MTELQSALQHIVGWLEENDNLDRFAGFLNPTDPKIGAWRANQVFEQLRDAIDWQTEIDDPDDWEDDF